jgi:predicted MPP superfamily phosphohydrolase
LKRYRYALWLSLAVGAFTALSELLAVPIHAAGRAQGILGYIIGASHLTNMPGFTLTAVTGMQTRQEWTAKALTVAILVSSLFWGVAAAIIIRLRYTWAIPAPSSESTDKTDATANVSISRRSLIINSGRALAAAGMASASWSFFGESRWWEITRRQVPIKGLSPGLNGLRIVQLTDIHHCSWMSLAWVRQIVDAANALAPDVVALTGDYIYHGLEYVRPVASALAQLKPRIGVVGVMGNHDWWENGELTQWTFAREGLPLIDNKRLFITPQRRLVTYAREGLCLAGVGDLWEDKCLYDKALGLIPGGMPRILLSHNPDVAEQPDFLTSGLRVDLMLSGHTHGGQIRLPGIGAPVTNSAYGQKYAKGLVDGPVCPVFISRGLGMTVMPIRFGVRPEIAVIELRCA